MKPALINLNIILVLLFFADLQSFSQDRIILNSGDSINCYISRITRKHLYYTQNFDGVSVRGKILKDRLREWSYVAEQNETQPEVLLPGWENIEPEKTTDPGTMIIDRERIRFSINGGPAYLLGTTDQAEEALQGNGVTVDDSKIYYDDLKLGYQVKSSFYMHAFGDYWLGALYNGFYTTSEITTTLQMDDVYMYFGKLGERYFVNFAGPSLFSVTRYGNLKKFGVNSSFTIGPAFYRNETEMFNEQILIQGTSLATHLTLGLEYFIQPKISMSLESALFSSRLKKLTVNNGQTTNDVKLEKGNYENLSRFDLSLGFIFYW